MSLDLVYKQDEMVDAVSEIEIECAGETPGGCIRTPEQRFERFEPITVRAAARVLQLQRAGVVSEKEARFYVRELAAMDAHAGQDGFQRLLRAAQRRAATGRRAGGVATPASRRSVNAVPGLI